MIKTRLSRWLIFFTFVAAVALVLPAKANAWPLPSAGNCLAGEDRFHVAENNSDSLEAIAKKCNVGFLALLQVNPGADPHVSHASSVLTAPLQTPLPDALREGTAINTAELRLYYYPSGKDSVTVYPIGIGRLDDDTLTPVMVITVSDKRADPTWTPTINVCTRHKAQRIELPAVVPTGSDSPMGHHVTCLVAYSDVYLFHGTNADSGIGMRVSSDCIRLRGDDIKTLFSQITPGTKTNIVNTPIKVSTEPNDTRLAEVHRPLSERIDDDLQLLPITPSSAMQSFKDATRTDAEVTQHVMDVRSGLPADVRCHQVSPQTL